MKSIFDARIARAGELADRYPAARELLLFYRDLAVFQRLVFAGLQSTEIRDLTPHFAGLLELVHRSGKAKLAELGGANLNEELLLRGWQDEIEDPAKRFYARVLLQPYGEFLASRGAVDPTVAGPVCPFCNARPVAAVLRGEGDGGKRWLLCSICSTQWQFRRVLCPNCAEEDKEKLPVYTAAEFEHVRAEACDSCKTYIKAIDLTRDGHAVPVVDEIATVALSLWAEERGYRKIESNLLGL
jgi:FdhE protein